MRHALLGLAVLSLALTACNRPASDTGATTTAPQTTAAEPARKPRPRPVTAGEIAQIEASGKTGLWSDVTEVCRKEVRTGIRTTLTWNVKASGTEQVVLYVIGKNGEERNFARGGPVGRQDTGPWLKPGLTFKLRRQDNKEAVGSVTIGEKQC